jgi:hypothetical protein
MLKYVHVYELANGTASGGLNNANEGNLRPRPKSGISKETEAQAERRGSAVQCKGSVREREREMRQARGSLR